MGDGRDIELLLKSHFPIIVIENLEELRVEKLLGTIAIRLFRPLLSWSITDGLRRRDLEPLGNEPRQTPEEVLWTIRRSRDNGIYILKDFHPYLDEPLHVRLLKDIAFEAERNGCTVVLLSHHIVIPEELTSFTAKAELAMPTRAELEKIVLETAREWKRQHNHSVQSDQETFNLLVRNLSGLSAADARRLARNAIFDDGTISESDIPQVMKAKHALLRGDGVLTYEFDTSRFSEVGGLNRLKGWLSERQAIFLGSEETAHLDAPKGLLLLGVQGGGKSLAAKAVAGMWHVPLLRLDFAAVYNKYHGETERQLRESLKSAEAMAPCVLWIDEIEKGLSTGQSDGGTSQRVLGTLLTWMAERKEPVFLVATANNIERLPPELMRKGRFDEIFFVDLPNQEVREEIFAIHLKKRQHDPAQFDTALLAAQSDGFSGAEIEQAVVAALYATHSGGEPLTSGHILSELNRTRPLSYIMREKIDALRAWAAERTVASD